MSELEERKYSDNYMYVLFGIVSGVLDSAVDDKLLRENPCRAKTVRRPAARSRKVVVWPDDRVAAIRRGLTKVNDRYRVVVPVGAGLGLRQGELLGLSPDDIDREALVVHIRRQVKFVKGCLMFALPKREKERFVPIPQSLVDEVDAHISRYPAQAVTLPWGAPDGELFNKVVWRPAFALADLEYRSRADGMHTALRHLYACKLLAHGVSVKELADFLGHEDPGFTLRVYTHLLSSSNERVRMAVDAASAAWAIPDEYGPATAQTA